MNRLETQFARKHVVLPVIHAEDLDQVRRNLDIVRVSGADGAFLINHSIAGDELLAIHAEVLHEHAGFWIGINLVDFDAEEVFAMATDEVAGIWVDDASIDERLETQESALHVTRVREQSGWAGIYFGGVAFKYQREVEDLAAAARIARERMDVVTTSGPGTGEAADVRKIAVMKEALRDAPLAIASGITPENVAAYLPIADAFLVATGISETFLELDPERLDRLLDIVRS